MTEKDTFWFRHDSNAKDDPKCVLLIEQLGLEGYGIFWILIEILREQKDYSYQLALIPAIARRYNTTSEKVKAVVLNYGLFEIVDDKFFFSKSLALRMESYNTLKAKRSEASRIANQARWNNPIAIPIASESDTKRIPNASQTDTNRMPNGYESESERNPNGVKTESDCSPISSRVDRSRVDKNRLDIKEEPPKGGKKKSDREKWISTLKELNVEDKIIEDWLKIRKEKKLALTDTALEDAINEFKSIPDKTANELLKYAIVKGWGGFKSKWYINETEKDNQSNSNYDRKYSASTPSNAMSFEGVDYGESTIHHRDKRE